MDPTTEISTPEFDGIITNPITDHAPPNDENYYLGDTFSIAVIVTSLILAILAVALNISIMKFHYEKKKSSIVSFIYYILGLSDFCTGVCAFLHAIIFTAMLIMKENLHFAVYWLIVPAYFLTTVAFKSSAFVSMVFAVIRTINIVYPFQNIRKRAVVASIALYTFFWMVMFAVEIGFILKNHILLKGGNGANANEIHDLVIGIYFYAPNRLSWVESIAFAAIPEGEQSTISFCPLEIAHTVLPFTLCAIITIVGTVVQLKILLVPPVSLTDESDTAKDAKKNETMRITHTIVIISTFFVLCTSCSLYYPIYEQCINPGSMKSKKLFYSLAYIPFFVNAAGNPFILMMRVKSYRNFLVSRMFVSNTHKIQDIIAASTSRKPKTSLSSLFGRISQTSLVATHKTEC